MTDFEHRQMERGRDGDGTDLPDDPSANQLRHELAEAKRQLGIFQKERDKARDQIARLRESLLWAMGVIQ